MKSAPSEALREDSELVLWTLKIQQHFKDKIHLAMNEYGEVVDSTKELFTKDLWLNEERLKWQRVVDELQLDRPTQYIRRRKIFLSFIRDCYSRYANIKQNIDERIANHFRP